MDWKLLLSTFVTVFVAELGDKTQLATFSLASGNRARWTVFAGASLALVGTSAMAVLLGDAAGRAVPAAWLRRAGGALFLIMGALMLLRPADG